MIARVPKAVLFASRATFDIVLGRRPPSGRGPGRRAVVTALVAETSLFLWMTWGLTVQWQASVALATTIVAVLALELAAGPRGSFRSRPWPVSLAIGFAMVLDLALSALLVLLLFFITAQGALAGKGILPIIAVPIILGGVLSLDVGMPLFLTLTLVLILALGMVMDAGPVVLLAVPLVLSLGISVILFRALSPNRGPALGRFLGSDPRGRYHRL